MPNPWNERTAQEQARAADQAAHEAEVGKLNARILELEGTRKALGKAIGRVRGISEHERPLAGPATVEPSGS